MLFSRSLVASALLGYAAATTHLSGNKQTVAASEALKATATASSALAAVAATNGPAAGAAAGSVNTHVIQVGGANASTIFSPSNVVAEVGDLVQFQFNAKNHSVVQSTFDQPCKPIQDVMPNKTDAFFSGFMPNNRTFGSTKDILTYTIRVTSKTPVWFYCSQAKHCQAGMVGAINAATSGNKTVAAFAALAKVQTENLSPGQAAGAAGGAQASAGVLPPAAASSAAAGDGAAATNAANSAAGAATGSSTASPAQSTGGVAGLTDAAKQSLFGLGLSGLAALVLL